MRRFGFAAAWTVLAAALLLGPTGCAHGLKRDREPRLQPAQGPVETSRKGLVVHTKTVTQQFP